jgi:UrcA family protein
MDQLKTFSAAGPAKNIVDTAIAPGTFTNFVAGLKDTRMLAAALVFVGLTIVASPSRANGVQTEAVSYKDLDLAWTEGAAVLYGRINAAAGNVCNSDGSHELREITEARACMDKAIADAVTQVNRPMLTHYYLAKIGKTAPAPTVAAESL